MALHPNFPDSPFVILDPAIRWFPADEALRATTSDKLMPPLVAELRKKVKEWRDSGYKGAAPTRVSLLNWWFNTPHLMPQADGSMTDFEYYFAQREALETIIYLYDVCLRRRGILPPFQARTFVDLVAAFPKYAAGPKT